MRKHTIVEYLDQLAARIPAPGGGAVAALHAAQAAALVEMVANYTTGPRYAEHAEKINQIITQAVSLREQAIETAIADAAAFTVVSEAYKLPKATEHDKTVRSATIMNATIAAARPPVETIVIGIGILNLAEELLLIGNRNVISDIAAAADAARAAISTGRINVEINLAGIKNNDKAHESLTADIAEVDAALFRADQLVAAVRKAIQ